MESNQRDNRRRHRRNRFSERYGRWALVAGASEGIGAAFARALAARGMNLILVARRRQMLERVAADCRASHPVDVMCLELDLATAGSIGELQSAIAGLEVGVAVYNAAYAPVGDFEALDPQEILRVVDVNVRGPAALVKMVVPSMIMRKRGAIVLMSSLAGNQGSPKIALYAASKSFNTILAEGLWHELKEKGIDVIACCAGAVRTPGYAMATQKEAPGTLDATTVVEQSLRALGHGPRVVPGMVNQLASLLMNRLLPRRVSITIMAGSTKTLAESKSREGAA